MARKKETLSQLADISQQITAARALRAEQDRLIWLARNHKATWAEITAATGMPLISARRARERFLHNRPDLTE